MAFRRKAPPSSVSLPPFDPDQSDVKKEIAEKARAVYEAAKTFSGISVPMSVEAEVGDDWAEVEQEIADADKEFMDLGKAQITVMQIGPDGKLTDVSDRIKPSDLKPEQIAGIDVVGGKVSDFNSHRSDQLDRERALELLAQILKTGRSSKRPPVTEDPSARLVREMEAALAKSDEILEHWKK